jgi:hypothetical protein
MGKNRSDDEEQVVIIYAFIDNDGNIFAEESHGELPDFPGLERTDPAVGALDVPFMVVEGGVGKRLLTALNSI